MWGWQVHHAVFYLKRLDALRVRVSGLDPHTSHTKAHSTDSSGCPPPITWYIRTSPYCTESITVILENNRACVWHMQRQAATKEIPTPLSVFTRRFLQTLAIALWRSNASHILQFHRRACQSARRVVGSGVVEELVAGPSGGI